MANDAKHAGLPYPVRGARFSLPVPYLDADGDPTDPTTPDTEISKDGGAFADCAEEVTTITGSNGFGYLTLTGAETDAALVLLAAKAASGPKATLAMLTPRVLPVIATGTATAGAAGTITLADSLNRVGCIVKTTGGTGGGGTGGANNQARLIVSQSGAVATVSPDFETAPDNTTTYQVLMTELAANMQMLGGQDVQSVAELSAAPAKDAGIVAKIAWLFMRAKNKRTNNGTTETVANDAGTTIASATVTDAGGTTEVGKFS